MGISILRVGGRVPALEMNDVAHGISCVVRAGD